MVRKSSEVFIVITQAVFCIKNGKTFRDAFDGIPQIVPHVLQILRQTGVIAVMERNCCTRTARSTALLPVAGAARYLPSTDIGFNI